MQSVFKSPKARGLGLMLLCIALSCGNPYAQTITVESNGNVLSVGNTYILDPFEAVSGAPSDAQSFTISGDDLTGNVQILHAGSIVEFSLDNATFADFLELTAAGGDLIGEPITVYMRVKDSAPEGSINNVINFFGGGIAQQILQFTGSVAPIGVRTGIAPENAFIESDGVTRVTWVLQFDRVVQGIDISDFNIPFGTSEVMLGIPQTLAEGTLVSILIRPQTGLEIPNATISFDLTGITRDSDGTVGTGTFEETFAIDTQRPDLTSITIDDTQLVSGETAIATFTFSEAVAGFDLSDVDVPSTATLGTLSTSDNITFTATLTPDDPGASTFNYLTVREMDYQDVAGNAGSVLNSDFVVSPGFRCINLRPL